MLLKPKEEFLCCYCIRCLRNCALLLLSTSSFYLIRHATFVTCVLYLVNNVLKELRESRMKSDDLFQSIIALGHVFYLPSTRLGRHAL